METRTFGKTGETVSALGYGCMGLSGTYGPADDAASLKTLHAAMEAGITLFDTGDFYGHGHNELLLSQALKGRRDKVFLQVKFGAQRAPGGAFIGFDASPAAVKSSLAYSLVRLGTDHIDLYQPARIDPKVPVEETVGAIADLVKDGLVRHIGLSEASADTIRRAHKEHPLAAVQMEYSLMSRSIEREVLGTARELGLAVTAYGVLSRGLIGGQVSLEGQHNIRHRMPRFAPDNLARNQQMVDALAKIGKARGATPAQIALAWVCSRGDDIFPLIGTRSANHLGEAIAACDIHLEKHELAAIEKAVPADQVAGDRYPPALMAELDSEGRHAV
jgi:aryl-alcohol dehydrogenase-like predicted oxidoreductase